MGDLLFTPLLPSCGEGLTLACSCAYLPAFQGIAPFLSKAFSPLFSFCPPFGLACWMCPLALGLAIMLKGQ